MKVLFKGLTGIVLGCICFVCAAADTWAGTGIYVGKDVSAENTTLIGASMEGGIGFAVVPVIFEKGTFKEGDEIECANGYKYTLPEDSARLTLERIMTYAGCGEWNCCASNEYGVSVVAGVTVDANLDAADADPFEACGICEDKIPLILASTSKNAKEAVDLLCSIYDGIGADTAEIVLIADQDGAWLVENFTGHQYAAIKLPADKMATFSNEPVITAADLESKDAISSADLLTLPVDKGFAVYDDNKNLDLIRTYCYDGNYSNEAHLRGWIGHSLFGEAAEGIYDPKVAYDVFFAPEGKISIRQAFDFFRNRYEGTNYEVSETEDRGVWGGIDNQYVANVNVVQIFPDVPAQMSSVIWATPSQALASPFIPIPAVADSIPEILATDVKDDGFTDGVMQFDFARLNTRIVARRDLYGSSVKSYWEGEENLCVSDVCAKVTGEWKDKYASAADSVAADAGDFLAAEVKEIDDMCHDAIDKFDWYLYRNGVTSSDVPDEELAPFVIDSAYTTLGDAAANGWDISVNGDVVTATKDGKTIEFTLGGEEESVRLVGFDTESFLDEFFADDDDFYISLDDVESSIEGDDGLEITVDDLQDEVSFNAGNEEASDETAAEVEEAADETAEEAAEETAEEAAPAEEAEDEKAEEAAPAEEAEDEKAEEAAPAEEAAEEKAEEAAPAEDAADEKAEEEAPADFAQLAAKTAEVDTIAELESYFAEKISSVPRDGWAENEIAGELAGVSNDVVAILGKYFKDFTGDFDDVERIMSMDPNVVATDEDIANAGAKLAEAGTELSGLMGNYFNSLAEDVSSDVVSGRLSQEGAVKILTEAGTDIAGFATMFLEGVAGTYKDVFDQTLSDEEFEETLKEIDDALGVLDEYGVVDKDAIGLGDAKLADLADLTDADINVVVTLDAMDDDTIDGLSQIFGVDVRAALDEYMEQIKAAGIDVKVKE